LTEELKNQLTTLIISHFGKESIWSV